MTISQTEKKYVAVHLNELLLFISNPAIFFSYIMVRTSYFEWDDDELRFVLDLHGWLDCKLQKGCIRLPAASDQVYQLLAHGRWFSPGTPASSTTKNGIKWQQDFRETHNVCSARRVTYMEQEMANYSKHLLSTFMFSLCCQLLFILLLLLLFVCVFIFVTFFIFPVNVLYHVCYLKLLSWR
jgi:hypothetical protein